MHGPENHSSLLSHISQRTPPSCPPLRHDWCPHLLSSSIHQFVSYHLHKKLTMVPKQDNNSSAIKKNKVFYAVSGIPDGITLTVCMCVGRGMTVLFAKYTIRAFLKPVLIYNSLLCLLPDWCWYCIATFAIFKAVNVFTQWESCTWRKTGPFRFMLFLNFL